jgi:cytochrome P450
MPDPSSELAAELAEVLPINPFSPEFRADPYSHYRRLREQAPLYRSPLGFWLLSRYRDCAEVLRDPRWGHRQDGDGADPIGEALGGRGLAIAPGEYVQVFLYMDPPDHTRLRNLVAKAFTARAIERLEPRIRRLTEELVDAALEAGEVDLIEALAFPLPMVIMSELVGAPASDRDLFKRWTRMLARGLDPDFLLPPEIIEARNQAAREFADYIRSLITQRRRRPGEDLLSALVMVEERGHQLTETELVATTGLLLAAGHETTVNLIGNGMLALLRHPDQLRRLRDDPAIATSAVEELLRYDSSDQLTPRKALQDIVLDGQPIHQGEAAVVLLGAANRDPEAFPEPDRLDLTRSPNRHLSFGHGIHYCLGAPLARLESRIAITTLLSRAPNIALAATPQYKPTLALRGLESLPVDLRGEKSVAV